MKTIEESARSRSFHRLLVPAAILVLVSASPCLSGDAPGGASGSGGASTGSSREKVRVYTNADLKALEPLPSGTAPAAGDSVSTETVDWAFILDFIERERAFEEQRRDRELEAAAIALAASQNERSRERYLLPNYFPGLRSCRNCPPRPVLPMPSNPMVSLKARGIRTANDLLQESLRDSQIRRSRLP